MKDVFKKYMNGNIKLDLCRVLGVIFLVFIISGIFGWIYEFIFYYFNGGMEKFYWRCGNFLTFINIYG